MRGDASGAVEQTLREAVLAHAPPDARAALAAAASWSASFAAGYEEAQRSYPRVALAPTDFARFVAQRLPNTVEAPAVLETMHVVDLYLACACAAGQSDAVEVFERAYAGLVLQVATRYRAGTGFPDELRQAVLHRLFVPDEPGGPLRIAQYSGRGPLVSWVRMVAVRTALNALEVRRPDDVPVDEETVLAERSADPELAFIKAEYREAFRQAFRAALDSISARERTVLKLYLLDALTLEEIGGIYQVNRSTVSRWLTHAREVMLEGTRDRLAEALELPRGELDSMVRLLHSQLDVSIGRILKSS